MEISYKDKDLEELVCTGSNHRYRKYQRNRKFMESLSLVIDVMRFSNNLDELKQYSFLHYEHLVNDDRSSVRIMNGRKERLLFIVTGDAIHIEELELDETHYGQK